MGDSRGTWTDSENDGQTTTTTCRSGSSNEAESQLESAWQKTLPPASHRWNRTNLGRVGNSQRIDQTSAKLDELDRLIAGRLEVREANEKVRFRLLERKARLSAETADAGVRTMAAATDPELRESQRADLIARLQRNESAEKKTLEALKKGKSLSDARGQRSRGKSLRSLSQRESRESYPRSSSSTSLPSIGTTKYGVATSQVENWNVHQPSNYPRVLGTPLRGSDTPQYIRGLKQQLDVIQSALDATKIGKTSAASLPGCRLPGLAPELHNDEELCRRHLDHVRHITLMRYEIEKKKCEAELEALYGQTFPPTIPEIPSNSPGTPDGCESNVSKGTKHSADRDSARPSLVTDNTFSTRGRGNSSRNALENKNPKIDADVAEKSESSSESASSEWSTDVDSNDPSPGGENMLQAKRFVTPGDEVLELVIFRVGPLSSVGQYRIGIVLYEAQQPLHRIGGEMVRGSTKTRQFTADPTEGNTLKIRQQLALRNLQLSDEATIVFELYSSRPAVDGARSKEMMVAWAYAPIKVSGTVVRGLQSTPVHRLPLMLAAHKKCPFNKAMLDFEINVGEDIENEEGSRTPKSEASSAVESEGAGEDVEGVPTAAWCIVNRGVPPADPFRPGDGIIIAVDWGRFLPENMTISKVVAEVYSVKHELLQGPFEWFCTPESDALNPHFRAAIDCLIDDEDFRDPTATILFTVYTVQSGSFNLCKVGFALLNLFVDPADQSTQVQPLDPDCRNYVLNQGAFQIPLSISGPSRSKPFRADSLEQTPRLACSSLLVRILTEDGAKAVRQMKPPEYADRDYDTSRAVPNAIERKLYILRLARPHLSVREAAKMVAKHDTLAQNEKKQAKRGGILGRQPIQSHNDNEGGIKQSFGAALKSKLGFGKKVEENKVPSARTKDPDLDNDIVDHRSIPGFDNDASLMEWIRKRLRIPERWMPALLNYNRAATYIPQLGFQVSLDGCSRLRRAFPHAALTSLAPPGSYYQDTATIDDVKVTLDFDPESQLGSPRWLDGYQQFRDVKYDGGLCVIVDVRTILLGNETASPVGWACLPVFDAGSKYVNSGQYQLPLFHGIPSGSILKELALVGEPEVVMESLLKSGKVRFVDESPSVFVRLLDEQHRGQLQLPTFGGQSIKVPQYLLKFPKIISEMKKTHKTKTYSKLKPKLITWGEWVDKINDISLQAAGLDEDQVLDFKSQTGSSNIIF